MRSHRHHDQYLVYQCGQLEVQFSIRRSVRQTHDSKATHTHTSSRLHMHSDVTEAIACDRHCRCEFYLLYVKGDARCGDLQISECQSCANSTPWHRSSFLRRAAKSCANIWLTVFPSRLNQKKNRIQRDKSLTIVVVVDNQLMVAD